VPLPQIEEGAEMPDAARRQVAPMERSPHPGEEPAPAGLALPVVGEGADVAPAAPPIGGPTSSVTLPAVGASEPPVGTPSAQQVAAQEIAAAEGEPGIGTPGTRRAQDAAKSDDEPDEAATLFPDIG
jgi:hypothetical protein